MKLTQDQSPEEVLLLQVFDPETLNTYSLVLSAADISHRVVQISFGQHEVFVAANKKTLALKEINSYIIENVNWPPQTKNLMTFSPTFQAMAPLIVGCLSFIFGITGDWRPESLWFTKGAGNGEAILQNLEFYRLITALTLHADIGHLLSNCFLGVFLLHFYFQLTGNGIGIAAILLLSGTANLLNTLVHGPGHMFVGFSTAVFCIIGMLCTMSFAFKTNRLALHLFMPIMAGLALLALLGSEGDRTDLGSHLFGLICGLIGGNFVRLPFFHTIRDSFLLQTVLGITTTVICYGCWVLALY